MIPSPSLRKPAVTRRRRNSAWSPHLSGPVGATPDHSGIERWAATTSWIGPHSSRRLMPAESFVALNSQPYSAESACSTEGDIGVRVRRSDRPDCLQGAQRGVATSVHGRSPFHRRSTASSRRIGSQEVLACRSGVVRYWSLTRCRLTAPRAIAALPATLHTPHTTTPRTPSISVPSTTIPADFPTTTRLPRRPRMVRAARVAQLVEHFTCNEDVAGSIPASGSTRRSRIPNGRRPPPSGPSPQRPA
jgi:hypothetical protein